MAAVFAESGHEVVGVDPVPYTPFNSCVVRFRAKRPVFQALLDAAHLDAGSPYQGGVKVKKVVDDGAIIPRVFDPQHPLADKDGYTYRSNVNEVTEMVEMMEAARSYQNNVEVINTARDLTMRTVDALKS